MALNDATWAPLRDSVSSFRQLWSEITTAEDYDPTLEGIDLAPLAEHLVGRAAADKWEEYADFCTALERVYRELSPVDAEQLLTADLLYAMINSAEARRLDLFRFYRPLGPRSREGWRAAYSHIHYGREYVPRPVA
jgi:hypothetical protein